LENIINENILTNTKRKDQKTKDNKFTIAMASTISLFLFVILWSLSCCFKNKENKSTSISRHEEKSS